MLPNTPLFRMTDRMVGGDLAGKLAEYRAHQSWTEIAKRLYAEHGVEVSDETLRGWGQALGIPDPKAASA